MIGAISNALQGLTSAAKAADQASERIANASSEGSADTVDLSEEAINLKVAELSYKANIASVKTATAMSDELMRLFDERV